MRADAFRPVVFDQNLGDLTLLHVEPFLTLARRLEPELIGFLVALRARAPHAGALGGVQHAELDAGGVGVDSHLAAERVDLAHHLSLGQSADGWVARHLADGVQVHGQEQRLASHARGSQRRLDAGMARPDDDDVIALGIDEHGRGVYLRASAPTTVDLPGGRCAKSGDASMKNPP